MQIDIRESIKKNFKDVSTNDIKLSIEEAISENDEITLPGLGVFFETLWKSSTDKQKEEILNKIKKNI
ncbi:MAG: small acid-soluble spore protein SspI [Bacilli bacterium]|nr:small acid-soluble spore protein SspI [Bacilli bacterium]MCI9433755.1 small acid-soluble spore protein SspI [Bacilli bacterium]